METKIQTQAAGVAGQKNIGESKTAEACPYCGSRQFVRRGTRRNKHQIVQLYLCRASACNRTFTAQDVKGKKFPLNVVIEGMSYYNLGFTLEQSCSFLKQKFGIAPDPQTLSSWLAEYEPLCRYARLRPYAVKMCKPQDTVEVVTMAHRQLYRFRYHRAKIALMLEEFRNRHLGPLKEFLDNISSETPHQFFAEGSRMSEICSRLDKSGMLVKSKSNFANRLANFVLQTVAKNKDRHEQLQRFLVANDSVTVATEVPVYIRREDIEHLQNVLGFKVVGEEGIRFKGGDKKSGRKIDLIRLIDLISKKISNSNDKKEIKRLADKFGIEDLDIGHCLEQLEIRNSGKLPRLLTGHIDIVQVRNGQVHLLDYKPNAAKEKPIEQLTWYALAMSRLTGLRLFDFTCGWFDEKDYFQFYPLHVVKKLNPKARKARKIFFKDGTWTEVPRKDVLRVV